MNRRDAKDFKWFQSDRDDIYKHIDKIYDHFESKKCSSCKYNIVDYTIDTQEFRECKNENSLMYCTNLSDTEFEGTHSNWGCNQWAGVVKTIFPKRRKWGEK